jgi:hypothetical protein
MRLEEYWGIGPKTRDLLAEALGVERAIEAVESADVRALAEAGIPRGRATRILRHAHGGEAMDLLATRDARNVYKDLLDLVGEFALTEQAHDRIRILTPLEGIDAMESRLNDVFEARETWESLDDSEQDAVGEAFENYDSVATGDAAAVRTALALQDVGVDDGVFEPVADLDGERLGEAEAALAGLESGGDRIGTGADERLDALRDQLAAVEDLTATPTEVLESVKSGARGTDELQDAFARHVADESGVDIARVREAMATDAADASGFVGETLRTLADALRSAVRDREQEVTDRLEGVLDEASAEIHRAVELVDDLAFALSLARFAIAYELTRPQFVDREVSAVVEARNLFLVDAQEAVQPITYAVGEHDLSGVSSSTPPSGDRVAVLTGANSGGKTTLLETLCQVQVLAQMGLPVPATDAEVSAFDTVVFHRRHASFNAGVLESTLRSVVPPVTDEGRALMLVDEFEAITEPGSAADLLHGLVTLTVETAALGVFVTHLADDLEPLPAEARTDGIFAEGLTTDLELEVDYQPRFETVGRSTPEFIVSRLVANAGDHAERAGYETLAESIGESAVQRTLADARWSG